ncbi:hypothetical protein C5167_025906 [Papaver somniferum]|uniref:Uncharacterized protein n=1 Tax=Papaver somniferum TaxID=3469 RepID=A0A4Y7JU97_PAPSO|nr:hypothetical protein C5167_025906 [Papaver somniferum]
MTVGTEIMTGIVTGNERENPTVPGIMIPGVAEDHDPGRGIVLQGIMAAIAAGGTIATDWC